jgi:hypothetical protein
MSTDLLRTPALTLSPNIDTFSMSIYSYTLKDFIVIAMKTSNLTYIYRVAEKWVYPPFIFNTIVVMVECLIWART